MKYTVTGDKAAAIGMALDLNVNWETRDHQPRISRARDVDWETTRAYDLKCDVDMPGFFLATFIDKTDMRRGTANSLILSTAATDFVWLPVKPAAPCEFECGYTIETAEGWDSQHTHYTYTLEDGWALKTVLDGRDCDGRRTVVRDFVIDFTADEAVWREVDVEHRDYAAESMGY